MPIRGETIGTAYVRVLTDGSELDESLERQLREHTDAFEAAGRRDSEAYAAGMEEGMQGPSGKRLSAALNFAIAEQDLTNDYFESDTWKDFEKSLKYRYGKAGQVAALEFAAEFKKRGNLAGVEEGVLDITPRIVHATETITKAEEERAKAEKAAADDREKYTKDFLAQLDKITDSSTESFAKINREFESAKVASNDARRAVVEYAEAYGDFAEAEKAVKKLNDQHHRGIGIMRQSEKRFDALAEPVGRLFGRGSRNNALNFFGSVITNVLKLGALFFKVAGGIFSAVRKATGALFDFFSGLSKGVQEGSGYLAAFGAQLALAFSGGTLTTFATGGLNVVVSLVAMATAMGLVVFTAGTLVSILVLLGGVIIALAGTIYFSLIAALGALAAVIVPTIALIGGLVAAVFAFNDATGKMKKNMDALKKTAKGLFDVFKERLFRNSADDVKRLNDVLKEQEPIVKAVARGTKRFINEFIEGLEDPAFQKFTDRFERFIPQALRSMGVIASNTLAGLGGLFRAMIPLANDFLGWLEKISGQFAEFTNSKEGRQQIKEFLESAKESAKSFGGFLKQAGGLLNDLLTAGQDTGDSLFDSMADALERVRNYLEENPDAVKNFFNDAKKFAEDLGGAIEDVVAAIQKIDSPETRQAARNFIRVLGNVIEVAGTIINAYGEVVRAIVKAFRMATEAVLTTVEGIIGALAQIPGPAGRAARAAQQPFDEFKKDTLADFDDVEKGLGELNTTAAKFNPKLKVDTSGVEQALYTLRAKFYELMSLFNNGRSQANNTPTPSSPQTESLDSGSNRGNQRTIDVGGITVVSPQADPAAVAQELINGLVGLGY